MILVFPRITLGIIEASTMRSAKPPASATLEVSGPFRLQQFDVFGFERGEHSPRL